TTDSSESNTARSVAISPAPTSGRCSQRSSGAWGARPVISNSSRSTRRAGTGGAKSRRRARMTEQVDPAATSGDSLLFEVTDLKQWTYCPRVLYYRYCLPEIRPITDLITAGIRSHSDEAGREE